LCKAHGYRRSAGTDGSLDFGIFPGDSVRDVYAARLANDCKISITIAMKHSATSTTADGISSKTSSHAVGTSSIRYDVVVEINHYRHKSQSHPECYFMMISGL
jgi:hypothetical protein